MKERDIVINIGNCMDNTMEESRCPDAVSDDVENSVNISRNAKNVGGVSGEKKKKEKRMSVSAKKAPKPPRPPRGLSLDAADQKLIKEFSELLMIKRARMERMKALKKTKAAKESASSSGNFVAMILTILFCIVIIFQGCHPSIIWPRNDSPTSNIAPENNVVAFQSQRSLSPSGMHMLSEAGSPNGSGNQADGRKATN